MDTTVSSPQPAGQAKRRGRNKSRKSSSLQQNNTVEAGNTSDMQSTPETTNKVPRQHFKNNVQNSPRNAGRSHNALPSTPLKEQAYAGPEFAASPDPSSLPIPRFFRLITQTPQAQATPLSDDESSPAPSPTRVRASPMPNNTLDLFFAADRMEKQRQSEQDREQSREQDHESRGKHEEQVSQFIDDFFTSITPGSSPAKSFASLASPSPRILLPWRRAESEDTATSPSRIDQPWRRSESKDSKTSPSRIDQPWRRNDSMASSLASTSSRDPSPTSKVTTPPSSPGGSSPASTTIKPSLSTDITIPASNPFTSTARPLLQTSILTSSSRIGQSWRRTTECAESSTTALYTQSWRRPAKTDNILSPQPSSTESQPRPHSTSSFNRRERELDGSPAKKISPEQRQCVGSEGTSHTASSQAVAPAFGNSTAWRPRVENSNSSGQAECLDSATRVKDTKAMADDLKRILKIGGFG